MNGIDMSLFFLNSILLVGFGVTTAPDIMVLGSSPLRYVESEVTPKKCRYSRAYSMLQVRCVNLELERIPPDLKTDIQILDASKNRIRKLANDSLSSYTKLAYVYLSDNFVLSIERAAFEQQQYLEVLDLTKNAFDSLPRDLLRLPYLRKLYLGDNKLTDAIFENGAVTSPINYLQLSNNQLTKIPDLGPFPALTYLNVTENPIRRLKTDDIAPFCSLEVLHLPNDPPIVSNFDRRYDCECETFKAWVELRGIKLTPRFNCSAANAERCSVTRFSNATVDLHEQCRDILRLQAEAEKARYTWIVVASCVSAFIFVVFVGLCCVHKRNKKRRRKLKEQQRLAANNANTQLLNSNLRVAETT